jgi:hypothetical protein
VPPRSQADRPKLPAIREPGSATIGSRPRSRPSREPATVPVAETGSALAVAEPATIPVAATGSALADRGNPPRSRSPRSSRSRAVAAITVTGNPRIPARTVGNRATVTIPNRPGSRRISRSLLPRSRRVPGGSPRSCRAIPGNPGSHRESRGCAAVAVAESHLGSRPRPSRNPPRSPHLRPAAPPGRSPAPAAEAAAWAGRIPRPPRSLLSANAVPLRRDPPPRSRSRKVHPRAARAAPDRPRNPTAIPGRGKPPGSPPALTVTEHAAVPVTGTTRRYCRRRRRLDRPRNPPRSRSGSRPSCWCRRWPPEPPP